MGCAECVCRIHEQIVVRFSPSTKRCGLASFFWKLLSWRWRYISVNKRTFSAEQAFACSLVWNAELRLKEIQNASSPLVL